MHGSVNVKHDDRSLWTVNVTLNKDFQVPTRNDIFVREIILFFSVVEVQGALLVETPCEILPYCSFHADIVVHYTQTGHNVQVTGQDVNPIITQYMFVEQETNWQEDNCQQQKLPLFYSNLKSTFYNILSDNCNMYILICTRIARPFY